MKTLKTGLIRALIAFLSLPSLRADAPPAGPSYPPPGGVVFSVAGSAGLSSGRTNFYSNLDPSDYDELYWTFYSIDNPWHSSQGGSIGSMSYSGFNVSTGIATWNSTANMIWSTAQGTENISTRLVVQFQPYTGVASGPVASGFYTPVSAASADIGALPDAWPLLDAVAVTNPANSFQVWYRWETASGTPLLEYYNATSSVPNGEVRTSLSGGFYHTVPEPTSAGLVALGLGVLCARRRNARV